MKTPQIARVRFQPATDEERSLVRSELQQVLQSQKFSTSKRYPAFLRYVVEKTLEGHSTELKERTLGVEVFQRKSDYDTNSDTIVRFAAGEVRKRLTLVYHEHETDGLVQISLPPGSYVPEFFRPSEEDDSSTLAMEMAPAAFHPMQAEPASPEMGTAQGKQSSARRHLTWLVASAIAALLFSFFVGYEVHQRSSQTVTMVDRFWQPITDGPNPAILTAGASVFSSGQGAVEAKKGDDYPYVSMATAETISRLAGIFDRRNAHYILQPTSTVTLDDMRTRPVILIGAYNNSWTMRMLSAQRFRFVPQPNVAIYDSANPSRVWRRPPQEPYNSAVDYAIVARFRDPVTDSFIVVIAGIGKNGTEAAAEFATNNHYLALLNGPQMKNWETRNFEVVLKASVIDGKTGSPTIEDFYEW